jgi:hypothetical protein
LARTYHDPAASEARREATAVVFESFPEFVGTFEEKGWKVAGAMIPIAYTAWSLWLVATGIVLLAA